MLSATIVRHWRLKSQRYGLVGTACPVCQEKMFPPRDTCSNCIDQAQVDTSQAPYQEKVAIVALSKSQDARKAYSTGIPFGVVPASASIS